MTGLSFRQKPKSRAVVMVSPVILMAYKKPPLRGAMIIIGARRWKIVYNVPYGF